MNDSIAVSDVSCASPSSKDLLIRLQALKNWQQQALDQLLLSQMKEREVLSASLSTIEENLSPEKRSILHSNTSHTAFENQEETPIGNNTKSFEEILKSKLEEEKMEAENTNSPKIVKRPFLRKGSGLQRFQYTPPKFLPKPSPGYRRVVSPLKKGGNPFRNDTKKEKFEDSIDADFNQKIREADRQHKKELRDLAVFEILENVADKSSFISNSSIIERFMTEGSTSTPQASTAKKFESANQDESRHVRFADSFKYAEYTLEGDSDSDTMVTSYGVDDIKSDDPSSVKTAGDTFASDIVQKLRKKFDNTADSMITNGDSYIKMTESDKENLSVEKFCDKNSAAITKEKLTSGLIVSPPPLKRGLTASNPIWGAFKNIGEYNNEVSEALKEIQLNTDDYNGIMKHAGLIGIENNNTPAATTAIHSRILELEKEINVFRKEANHLRKSRKEADELKSSLTEEKNRFEKQMENEKRRWQLQIEEEKKKLKSSEKREDETSKLTDEVMELKNKLEELTNVTRTKESKWFAEKNKLLSRIRYLESQLKMKTDEITRLSKEERDVRKKLQSSLRPRPIYAQVKPQSASVEVQTESLPSPSIPCKAQPPSTPIGNTPQLISDQVQTPQSEKKTRDGGDRGKVVVHEDGTKEIIFESGNIKTIYKDGTMKTVYFNKDVKIVQPDGTIKYIYTAKGITQTTMNDGKEVLEYPEGHLETRFPSGKKEVKFPGGCFAVFHNDGSEERQWPNGTKLWRDSKGNQMMQMPNGDRETSTPTCKRRELPDGTLITTFSDGRKETRFPNGKVKVVDSCGEVLLDTRIAESTSCSK
ncbi:uncharacterized protein LOC136026611 [Artemia franciscana]|uniref:uncharacterized protein LOC136026611 n=1 Tax=Artemia franciscana TaxID=6661 RepID=UPI0032DBAEE1